MIDSVVLWPIKQEGFQDRLWILSCESIFQLNEFFRSHYHMKMKGLFYGSDTTCFYRGPTAPSVNLVKLKLRRIDVRLLLVTAFQLVVLTLLSIPFHFLLFFFLFIFIPVCVCVCVCFLLLTPIDGIDLWPRRIWQPLSGLSLIFLSLLGGRSRRMIGLQDRTRFGTLVV